MMKRMPDEQQSGLGWSVPSAGWVKVNFEGSVDTLLPHAAAGGVIRDSQGTWLVYWRVLLESDSLEAVQSINAAEHGSNAISLVRNIRALLHRPRKVQEAHIKREQNIVADIVVKSVKGGSIPEAWTALCIDMHGLLETTVM
ncbi:hypothetical protein J1N35_000265 [Gossypium stocksii]|uniref:RNase H type-1 domain-containing protein n=1 Tax=Gossypium stocksii TaxID=47602 RepID=A0A9D3WGT1_9ROSI|nr:hypothetical protein J1N35_000265 [Gossypium stocksii]